MSSFPVTSTDSLLGTENEVFLCELPRSKPRRVSYVYYEGKPLSHRLSFAKGNRVTFEIFLPEHGRDLQELSWIAQQNAYCSDDVASDRMGFAAKMLTFFVSGKIVAARPLFSYGYSRENTRLGEVQSGYTHWLVCTERGGETRLLLLYSRDIQHTGTLRRGSTTRMNWLAIFPDELGMIGQAVRAFLQSDTWACIPAQEGVASGAD